MHNNHLTKRSKLLESSYRCVWPGVFLMEHNSSPIYESWWLLCNFIFLTVQLLIVQAQIKLSKNKHIVDDSLPITPNTQKNLPHRRYWLGHCSHRSTAIRPRPFTLDVVVAVRFRNGSLKHKASLCNQPWLNGSKRFFVQCLAAGNLKQSLHDVRTDNSIILSLFSQL